MCPSMRQRDERGLLPGTTDRQKMDMAAGGCINSRSSPAPTHSEAALTSWLESELYIFQSFRFFILNWAAKLFKV